MIILNNLISKLPLYQMVSNQKPKIIGAVLLKKI